MSGWLLRHGCPFLGPWWGSAICCPVVFRCLYSLSIMGFGGLGGPLVLQKPSTCARAKPPRTSFRMVVNPPKGHPDHQRRMSLNHIPFSPLSPFRLWPDLSSCTPEAHDLTSLRGLGYFACPDISGQIGFKCADRGSCQHEGRTSLQVAASSSLVSRRSVDLPLIHTIFSLWPYHKLSECNARGRSVLPQRLY